MIRRAMLSGMLSAMVCIPAFAGDQWTTPTKEELTMTSQPEVPGAPAVYLYREETQEDALNMWSVYIRLKVLTERGKEYADVKLESFKGSDGFEFQVSDIAGRTIQPDGTVVPFTGKPYEKLVEKSGEGKVMAKVFSLPAVQVGSILEYRYKLRFPDHWFSRPTWYPQRDLYVRKAHFMWKPTSHELVSNENGHEAISNGIAWAPILPPGPTVKATALPTGQSVYELNINDIKPMPEENDMPPVENFSYRVYFYYTSYHTADEYWKNEGKFWSKHVNSFIGPNSAVQDFTQKTIAGATSSEDKLKKIYAAVMGMENTVYTRERVHAEQKKEFKSTDDVVEAGRGNDDQLAMLFIAMARAAGFKAYAMQVANRERTVFLPAYLSFSQLSDVIAIVNVDGQERFFDPGRRYTPFGHLDWRHTFTQGIRQSDNGTSIAETNLELYKFSHTTRIADLQLAPDGKASGTITITYNGQPAINWRQTALRGDETSLHENLRKQMERHLPAGMDVKVSKVENLTDYETPLKVVYDVSGPIGKGTATRLILPADILFANAKPRFVSDKRETTVYFPYTEFTQDAVRLKMPTNFTIESAPASVNEMYEKRIAYSRKSKTTPNSVTVWRDMVRGDMLFETKEYPALRSFYTKVDTDDQDSIVVKAAAAAPATSTVTVTKQTTTTAAN
ncbi:MAG: DUF3857 domain-containing protein [Acidobacteria bacterium]|nr:DUF3857 domain-containing protein [Acidobacteriota bacterium]